MVSLAGGQRLRGAQGQPRASRSGPERRKGLLSNFLFCPLSLCLTSHLSDLQGNTGAPGLPGLMGFPAVGIQGEKARPKPKLGGTWTRFLDWWFMMMFLWL